MLSFADARQKVVAEAEAGKRAPARETRREVERDGAFAEPRIARQ